ncbi:chromate transporter [Tsukamurella soli]|uniref:Chromate transporter n=1 Tax=Tsukamurella soli TaxID=644556 RepID=A0ABP8J426_9ACTN
MSATDQPFTPSRLQLFSGFALIGLTGFGGVLPSARHVLVDRRRWLTDTEFTELYSLAQFFPGPNVANVCVIYGRRYHGWSGAAAAIVGLYLFPTVLTIAAGFAIDRWWRIPQVQQTFGAIMPVASGLMVGSAAKLLKGMRIAWWTVTVLVATFVLMAVLGLSLWLVILLTAPTAVGLALLDSHRQAGPADR